MSRLDPSSVIPVGHSSKATSLNSRKTAARAPTPHRSDPRKATCMWSHSAHCGECDHIGGVLSPMSPNTGWLHAWPANDSSLRTSGSQRASRPLRAAPMIGPYCTCVLAVFCVLCFVCFGDLGRSLCFVFCVLTFARGTLLSRKRYALPVFSL